MQPFSLWEEENQSGMLNSKHAGLNHYQLDSSVLLHRHLSVCICYRLYTTTDNIQKSFISATLQQLEEPPP